VKSPPHQRQAIIDYVLGQSPEGTVVHHAEKVASERIYGFKHDVWDVDSSDGRWWVITNPTNLYPQETVPTPSMDHALALHIGVTARVMARGHIQAPVGGPVRDFVARAWRKFEQAAQAWNEGEEAEDFQAVGTRLRESLIAFAQDAAPEVTVPAGTEPPKRSDFKGWAELLVQEAAPGSSAAQMRSYLRVLARETWDLVVWLTHAANATRTQAEAAVDATSHMIQVLSLALITAKRGEPPRCPDCGSYQVVTAYYRDGEDVPEGFLLCEACGWQEDEAE
jgi:hypothetical protein